MAATTTQKHPYMFGGEKLVLLAADSSQYFHSASVVAFPTSIMGTTFGPFLMVTTAADCIQVPVDNFASRLGGIVIFEGVSSDCYPVVAVRVPPHNSTRYSPDNTPGIGLPWAAGCNSTCAIGMSLPGGQSSAADSGWKLLTTTHPSLGTATKAWMYALGPLDGAKFAIVAASSGDETDDYQPYFEFQFGVTTKAPEGATSTKWGLIGQGIHWSTFSTTQPITNYGSTSCQHYFLPIEFP